MPGAWVLQSFLVVHAYARADSAWRTVIVLLLQPALRVLVFVAEVSLLAGWLAGCGYA